MENMGLMNRDFWRNKRVFITGHTGFKGSWLSIWLQNMGAIVTGFSLPAPTDPSLFKLCAVEQLMCRSIIGDILDAESLTLSMRKADPEIVIHMAAQPLVKKSYQDPVQTFSINVMGTVNVFEAVRRCHSVRAVLNVTTDKCYSNREWDWGYRESDPVGGIDPYSGSKACSELITDTYRNSFFSKNGIAIGTARAGNVIGFGDWSPERLVPDILRSFLNGTDIQIRNPNAVRPWQHVLEPLSGYLLLVQKLYQEGEKYAEAWNFGPLDSETRSVKWIVEAMLKQWPKNHPGYTITSQEHFHEANLLKLDCSKAANRMEWRPRWSLSKSLDYTIQGFLAFMNKEDLKEICESQIMDYECSTPELS